MNTEEMKSNIDKIAWDAMAKEYEEGTWEGHGEITRGRPKQFDEDMENDFNQKIIERDLLAGS